VFSGPLGNSGGDWFNPSIAQQFSDSPNIDHGKSTLADRLIEHTRTVPEQDMRAQMLVRNETIGKLVILLLPPASRSCPLCCCTHKYLFRGAVVGRPCSAWGFAVQPFRQLERNLVRIVPWPRCPGRSTTAAVPHPSRKGSPIPGQVVPSAGDLPAASLLRSREYALLCDKLPISTDWFNPSIAHQCYCNSEVVFRSTI
jgi:hypothetical protein